MTQKEILQKVIEVVKQSQEQSGRDIPDLDGDSHLMGDVPGCDSLILVELSLLLTDALSALLNGREIPDSILFGTKVGTHPTLNDIASDIKRFIEAPAAKRASSTSGVKATATANRNAKNSNPLLLADGSNTSCSNGTKPLSEDQTPKENTNEHNAGQPGSGTS